MTKVTGSKMDRGLGQKFLQRRLANGQLAQEKNAQDLQIQEAPVKTPTKYNIPSNKMATVKN